MWVRGWDTELETLHVADPRISGPRANVVIGWDTRAPVGKGVGH